jgi:predicted PurR-regulated permease PerM
MDPALDARLKAIEEKLQQNHELLVRVRRVQRNSQLFRLFYWVLILLATFGAFYYVQPYINQIIESYTGIQNTQEQIQNSMPNLRDINGIVNQFKGL